jgi:hypothetical protein
VRNAWAPQAERLVLEYLPLTFSRRHGDPSRPWNKFSIRVRDARRPARRQLPGQLARHLPELGSAGCQRAGLRLGSMVGLPGRDDARRLQPLPHRPRRHRLGSGGARQPLEPHRLLGRPPGGLPAQAAGSDAGARPGLLPALWDRALFSFADVPYRLKPHAEQTAHPKATIHFDDDGPPARPGPGCRRSAPTACWCATTTACRCWPRWPKSWPPSCWPRPAAWCPAAACGCTPSGRSGTTPTTRWWATACRW